MTTLSTHLLNTAELHIGQIITTCFEHSVQTLVVSDARSELAQVLAAAYKNIYPHATHIAFDEETPEFILQSFEKLNAKDLVVLIQSTSFRLNEFRIRVELFKRGLQVIEHPHLARMTGVEMHRYIDALAYDPLYYRSTGPALKKIMDNASKTIVKSDANELIFDGPLEEAKMNIGDYRDMNNWGGQFPIGEVFTEARDLESLHGRIKIFAFGDGDFKVNVPEHPITLIVEKGKIIATTNSTPVFNSILDQIIEREEVVWIRELGFGLNRALTRENTLTDIGSYERMCGVHLSLGVKHGVYKKPNFKQRATGFHLDVFVQTDEVVVNGQTIYKNGAWIV